MTLLKDKSAIRVFGEFRDLRQRRFWAIIFGRKAILCWHSGFRRKNNPKIHKMTGKIGTKASGVPLEQITVKPETTQVSLAFFGSRIIAFGRGYLLASTIWF